MTDESNWTFLEIQIENSKLPTRSLVPIPTLEIPYTFMTSIMLASTWLVPLYTKPVSSSALDGANIAHGTQSSTK